MLHDLEFYNLDTFRSDITIIVVVIVVFVVDIIDTCCMMWNSGHGCSGFCSLYNLDTFRSDIIVIVVVVVDTFCTLRSSDCEGSDSYSLYLTTFRSDSIIIIITSIVIIIIINNICYITLRESRLRLSTTSVFFTILLPLSQILLSFSLLTGVACYRVPVVMSATSVFFVTSPPLGQISSSPLSLVVAVVVVSLLVVVMVVVVTLCLPDCLSV